MERSDQKAGEARVREMLVEPLIRRGLMRPPGMTREQFAAMVDDLCQRLAYMSDLSLQALEEQAAANPGGKDRDRFPIGNRVLEWAALIQSPVDDGSPLVRAVFADRLGHEAVREGWAPELLSRVKRDRRWPAEFVIRAVRDDAREAVRRLEDLDRRVARGEDLSRDAEMWRDRRRGVLTKCRAWAEREAAI